VAPEATRHIQVPSGYIINGCNDVVWDVVGCWKLYYQ
jgi:hypothetical protein